MERRLSSRWNPSPEEQFAWGSQSTRRTLRPWRARQAARLMAVVVLPTPPFWLTRPRILPMAIQSNGKGGSRIAARSVENRANLWKPPAVGQAKKPPRPCRARLSRQGRGGGGGSAKKSVRWKTSVFLGRNQAAGRRIFGGPPFLDCPEMFHVEHSPL